MQLTFDEYDSLMDKFSKINTETYWPTREQINMFEIEPDKWLLYCIYIYEKGKPPVNITERYSKKNLSEFINKHLEII